MGSHGGRPWTGGQCFVHHPLRRIRKEQITVVVTEIFPVKKGKFDLHVLVAWPHLAALLHDSNQELQNKPQRGKLFLNR